MFSLKRFRHEGYNTCILTQVIDWPRVGIIELKLYMCGKYSLETLFGKSLDF